VASKPVKCLGQAVTGLSWSRLAKVKESKAWIEARSVYDADFGLKCEINKTGTLS
jgi:hypothetical protein